MATDQQSAKPRKQPKPHHRHPRRPPGFGFWVFVAFGSIPTVGTMFYNLGGLSWILAVIFVASILWHYDRLAVKRKPLARTTFSGACLLPVCFWTYVIVTAPLGMRGLGAFLCAMCGVSGFVALIGGWRDSSRQS